MANSFGLGETGFLVPTFDDILIDVQNSMINAAPQLSFGENKVETALSQVMANQIYCMWQELYNVYNSQNPSFASGCALDILGSRYGVQRLDDESDSNYRIRLLSIQSGSGQLSGSGCFDRLYNKLFAINGVTDVQINLNETQYQEGFLPPNSYEVMVLGGDESAIANAIWNCHPVGITLVGSNSFTIIDCTGVCRPISFTRPKLVPIFLDFYIERTSSNCGCPTNDTSIIKDAIQNALESDDGLCFTRIGTPVSVQDFFPDIYGIQGIGITEAYLSRDGLCADQQTVTLKRDEVPFFSPECCSVSFESGPQKKIEDGICDENQIDSEEGDYCYRCPPPECTFTLDITKTPDKTEFTSVGEVISYTYVITNTGVSTLLNPIVVVDDKVVVTCDPFPVTGLPVGDSLNCTSLYETTIEDAVNGGVTNKAQAIAGTVFSPCIEAFVEYSGPDLFASMLLEKSLVSGSCTAIGDILVYQYKITNTGNVPITTQPIISDDKISGIICPAIPVGGLLPNTTITATAQTPVTQQMLIDGECCNNARASATSILGNVVSNLATYCVDCSEDTNSLPTPPDQILIQDCINEFPYDTGLWTSVNGLVVLSSGGTESALGLFFSDNGDNTGTLTAIGPIQNGIITITGTDSIGGINTQNIVVNCDTVNQDGDITDPNPITPVIDVLDLNGDIQVSTTHDFFNSGVGPLSACGGSITGGSLERITHSNSIPTEHYLTISGNVSLSSISFSSSCAAPISISPVPVGSQFIISATEWQIIRDHLNCTDGYTLSAVCL